MKTAIGNKELAGIEPVFAKGRLGILAYAAMLVAAIFVFLPFTLYLGTYGEKKYIVREVSVAQLPPQTPPAPPQQQEPSPQPSVEPHMPSAESAAPRLNLTQMDMNITTGIGDAIAGAFPGNGFGMSGGDSAAELSIFELSELDRIPRLLRGAKPVYPHKMLQERVCGFVRLRVMIDTEGRVSVREVMEATNSEFEQAAVEAATKLIYEVPTRDGKPVNTQFAMPMRFNID
ncbi:MAG: energy transducer TonB [Opitutales bacterium]|jgi:TonB family protein